MKENVVVALATAERRAIAAADRIQRHGERAAALWHKIERKQGSRYSQDKAWVTRWTAEYNKIARLESRALNDFSRESSRVELFGKELRERQRRAAIERKKAGKPPLGKPLAKKTVRKKATKKELRERRRQQWEYVLKVDYTATRKARKEHPRHHHVWWDVRLRKTDGSKATPSELRMALRHVKSHGEAPKGWEAIGIRWDRGTRYSWDDVPSRPGHEQTGTKMEEALNQLSHTIGSTEGADFLWATDNGGIEVGEEEMDDE